MTASALKAIETHYKGYRFRSRLEARWAVFFETLGVQWEYEPEGFELTMTGWYLPDFWISGFTAHDLCGPARTGSFWFEVKHSPPEFNSPEERKLRELCVTSGQYGYFGTSSFFGSVVRAGTESVFGAWLRDSDLYQVLPHRSFVDRPEDGFCGVFATPPDAPDLVMVNNLIDSSPLPYTLDVRPLVSAARAALSARFEHGESP